MDTCKSEPLEYWFHFGFLLATLSVRFFWGPWLLLKNGAWETIGLGIYLGVIPRVQIMQVKTNKVPFWLGFGEFTAHFRLPILAVGLTRMFTGGTGFSPMAIWVCQMTLCMVGRSISHHLRNPGF